MSREQLEALLLTLRKCSPAFKETVRKMMAHMTDDVLNRDLIVALRRELDK